LNLKKKNKKMNYLALTLCFAFSAALLPAQERGAKAPVLIVPKQSQEPRPQKVQPELPPATPFQQAPTPIDRGFGAIFDSAKKMDDPTGPRMLPKMAPPFNSERVLMLVNGEEITSSDINQLVNYYQSFRPGAVDILIRDAVNALIPARVAKSQFAQALSSMDARIKSAVSAAKLSDDWIKLVKRHSDDKEDGAPNDGAYIFGRELAVQPFDYFSHTSTKGVMTEPFLTVYGYHILEVTDYQRGTTAKDDKSHVRHLLAMYPQLSKMEKDGKDVRAELKKLVAQCVIEISEPGLLNMVPAKLRGNIKE